MGIPGGFGSTLIGGLITAILYGIATLQTYAYYMHYSEDTLIIRFLVTGVWILDTLRVSFVCHFLYYYLITNYGIPTSLLRMVWSLQASVLVHTIGSTAVQCFFVHQIYYLCRAQVKWWVTTPIMLLVLAGTGLSMAGLILTFLNNEPSQQISSHTGTPAIAVFMLADILIAVSLCTLFYDNGSHSAFPRTKRLLNKLIIYTVNRCLLTLLVIIAQLAASASDQDVWTITLDFIVHGLYPNSLLASLNARQYLRTQVLNTVSDLPISTIDFAKMSKLHGHVESSEDGGGQFSVREEAAIDITADPLLGKITALRREAEMCY